jgi:hypothetical protein
MLLVYLNWLMGAGLRGEGAICTHIPFLTELNCAKTIIIEWLIVIGLELFGPFRSFQTRHFIAPVRQLMHIAVWIAAVDGLR